MEFDIVYHIETSQQFWSELEDSLQIPPLASLSLLDSALHRFVDLCAGYHEQYLQAPIQLEHACTLLLSSELFEFHSERMSDILLFSATSNTDPHSQLIIHHILLVYGTRYHPKFLRSTQKWRALIPMLMDHLMVEVDPETEDWGASGSANGHGQGTGYSRTNVGVSIETKLRQLSVETLYEVCRVQSFDMDALVIFDNNFIDTLFDLVEQTRNMQDETLNYGIIKLIVALNEQFMVASLPSSHKHGSHHFVPHSTMNGESKRPHADESASKSQNRILAILIRRMQFSKTFGENLIFMLNRTSSSSSYSPSSSYPFPHNDLALQLLILKLLYLLFTTPTTYAYFYTNDLRVLLDVFLRELSDLDPSSSPSQESLQHTYIRVLHPLLINTQLKSEMYKGALVLKTLEGVIANAGIRDVSPTTRRLVERCLGGEWCVQMRRQTQVLAQARSSGGSPTESTDSAAVLTGTGQGQSMTQSQIITSTSSDAPALKPKRSLKISRSVGDLKKAANLKEKVPPVPKSPLVDSSAKRSMFGGTTSENAASLVSLSAAAGPSIVSVPQPHSHYHSRKPSRKEEYNPQHRHASPLSTATAGDVLSSNLARSSSYSRGHGYDEAPISPMSVSTISTISSFSSSSAPSLSSATSSSSAYAVVKAKKAPPPDPPRRRKPPPVPMRALKAAVRLTSGASG